MNVARASLMLLRLLAVVQLVIGMGLWTGWWPGLVMPHMGLGVVYVVALWLLAVVAMARKHQVGLAAFALLWGVLLAGFGMVQAGLLVGYEHWVIRVLHIVIALAAMPMAEKLAARQGAPAVR
jgi:hypothetical protein